MGHQEYFKIIGSWPVWWSWEHKYIAIAKQGMSTWVCITMNVQDDYSSWCVSCSQSCNDAVFSGGCNVPCLVMAESCCLVVFVLWMWAVCDRCTADSPLAISRTRSHSGTVLSPPHLTQPDGSETQHFSAWRCRSENLPVLQSLILKSLIAFNVHAFVPYLLLKGP